MGCIFSAVPVATCPSCFFKPGLFLVWNPAGPSVMVGFRRTCHTWANCCSPVCVFSSCQFINVDAVPHGLRMYHHPTGRSKSFSIPARYTQIILAKVNIHSASPTERGSLAASHRPRNTGRLSQRSWIVYWTVIFFVNVTLTPAPEIDLPAAPAFSISPDRSGLRSADCTGTTANKGCHSV